MKAFNGWLFAGLCALTAGADAAIVYQSDGRYIHHTMGGTFTPTASYANFNVDWWAWEAGAAQQSVLRSQWMQGNGSVYMGLDAATEYGIQTSSVFLVDFTVDRLTDFVLTGSLNTGGAGGSDLYAVLWENGTEIFRFDGNNIANIGANPFSKDGQFSAGNAYRLMLVADAYWDTGYYPEAWQFDLTTSSEVPLPAAAWLLAAGLIGMARATRLQPCRDTGP